MKNFRTFLLAADFYKQTLCLKLPSALGEQLRRAAPSIALNLAEGRGRQSVPDQVRFFRIALGSVRECQAILILADLAGSPAWETLDSLAAHVYRLIQRAAA